MVPLVASSLSPWPARTAGYSQALFLTEPVGSLLMLFVVLRCVMMPAQAKRQRVSSSVMFRWCIW